MEFALQLPINSLSLGQVSTAILREIYKKGLTPCLFPIGNPDLSTQKVDQPFVDWLQFCINKSLYSHSREVPVIKLWHINGGLESVSKKQILFTFYELDNPTREEVNIVRNNDAVCLSSNQSIKHFSEFGLDNLHFVPLGFDKHNFSVKQRDYSPEGRIVFNLVGKLEKRKHHAKILKAWTKKFGNNPKYFLNCSIFNPFMKPEDQQNIINQILGQRFFNINFLGFMPTNELYNDYLNSGHIVIGMSGGEGWGLPEMQSVALGKHAVILNASAHKEWANKENSALVNPTGKIEAYDGLFFHKGQPFNQGSLYDFNDDEFVAACEKAIERVKANPVNTEGLKLQDAFTYENTTNKLLEIASKV
jgi:glycosyltransferase involved in cell wall biosynthesis